MEPRLLLDAGLVGEYFDDIGLTVLADTRTDPSINFLQDWGDAPSGTAVASDDNYSVRWTGFVLAEAAGDWTFYTTSNDGVRLWVDDTLLIDNWNQHAVTEDSGAVALDAGWHPIRLEYFQQNGTAEITLSFEGPGQAKAVIPSTHLNTIDLDGSDPVANAGPDRTVFLPDNSVTLDGGGSDIDGVVTDFLWTQISGPDDATLGNATTEDLTVSDLVQGSYVFQLLVTDNDGNSDSDTAIVTVAPQGGGDVVLTGELKRWHKLTLTFDGPATSEAAAVNPFLDYRMDVTFSHVASGKRYVVPGYFAADGDAANTGATSGDKWRAHFAPDEIGEWTWAASFRTGSEVAVADDPLAGTSAGFFDGSAGMFSVAETNKAGVDLRSKGRLSYVGERYLQFEGTGEYFLKQGPDAPENLLAYEDFDNTPNNGGRLKDYAPHAGDWNAGDPSWAGGRGTELIGAINYLASEGVNAFSFLTMNIAGDDENVFPYVSDTAGDRTRIDVSKLSQWEIVFEHADTQGMFLHFKTQETENDQLLDGGALGVERKLYYRELIARFGHHLALNWNLGEENTNTDQQRKDFAQYFHDNDPYQHHIVLHTYPGQKNAVYTPLLGNNSELTGASLQGSNAAFTDVHDDVLTWVANSTNAGKPWAIAVDEPGDAQHALRPDNDAGTSHVDGRKNALWGTLMAGGYGNEWYFGYGHDHSDLTLNDFRSRDQWWDYTRHALSFFNDNGIPFWEMQNDNAISTATDDYGFYKPGEVYTVYLKNGGTTELDLTGVEGDFDVQWYDPRNGGPLLAGTVTQVTGGGLANLGQAPDSTSEDWAILVTRQTAPKVLFIRGGDRTGGFLEAGNDAQRTEHLGDINNFTTGGGNHGWGTLRSVLEAEGFVVEQITEGSETASGPAEGIHIDLEAINLSQYAAVVFGSNNAVYDAAAVDALEQYIQAGGGALFISDANFGGDWADASNSDQQFLDRFGITVHQDQGTYVVGNEAGEILQPAHPLFAGVTQFDGEGVTPFHVSEAIDGVTVTLLAGAEGNTRLNQPPFGANNQGPSRATDAGDASVIAATFGDGRIIGHFDRNTFFNQGGAGTDITRFDNQQYAINLFRFLADVGALTGEVWDDADGDGTRDAGEGGLEGVTIYLDANLNGELDDDEPTSITSADGSYRFDGLAAGDYVVRQVVPDRHVQTSPVDGAWMDLISTRRIASGLNQPLYATAAPGDHTRLFILEKGGVIRVLDRTTGQLLPTPFLSLTVSTTSEQGLLGMAFDPDYHLNGRFYVKYTDATGDAIVSRFVVSDANPNVADASSEEEIIRIAQPATNHNGGWIGFGPDGYLYITSGDGGGSNDPGNHGQNINTLLGAMLRLDVSGDGPGYVNPADNPFVGTAGADEIWAYGLRNPWRSSFDRETGDFYIADVGQGAREEVNFQPADSVGGENYGWRLREGTIATPGVGGPPPAGNVDPIYDYTRGSGDNEGRSVTGGYVYRGAIPMLGGKYFFGDFISSRIWSIEHDGAGVTLFEDWTDALQPDVGAINSIASFGEDAAGNLYVVDFGGEVFELVFDGNNAGHAVTLASGQTVAGLGFGNASTNGDPSANADQYTTEADTPLVVDTPGVLMNDSDPDGDALSVIAFTQGTHGSVNVNADGDFTYTPNAGYIGEDRFTYTAIDGNGGSDTATVIINVTPRPAPPKVEAVMLGGTLWVTPFRIALDALDGTTDGAYTLPTGAAQTATLPWENLDTIRIRFSESVAIESSDLAIYGVNTANLTGIISGFDYDEATLTATWTFSQSLNTDKFLIHLSDNVTDGDGEALDGEWTTGVSTSSGDGVAGGDLLYRFNVLPGDVDQSGLTLAGDALAVIEKVISLPGQPGYDVFADTDGNGLILSGDALAVIDRVISFLPSGEPVVSAPPAIEASSLSSTAAANAAVAAEEGLSSDEVAEPSTIAEEPSPLPVAPSLALGLRSVVESVDARRVMPLIASGGSTEQRRFTGESLLRAGPRSFPLESLADREAAGPLGDSVRQSSPFHHAMRVRHLERNAAAGFGLDNPILLGLRSDRPVGEEGKRLLPFLAGL